MNLNTRYLYGYVIVLCSYIKSNSTVKALYIMTSTNEYLYCS